MFGSFRRAGRERVGAPRRWVSWPVAIAVFALMATACASIPSGGGVRAGPEIEDGEVDPDIVLGADAPQPGATQEEILTGFLLAAVDPRNNYETASLFLTEDFRDEWNPNAFASVRTGAGSMSRESDDRIEYTFRAQGTVDETGLYREDRPALPQTLRFEFERDDADQWRISSAPDGVVLSAASFDRVFDPYPLWFFAPDFRYLVPDVRWFASARSNLASAVVSELLEGPAQYLGQGAVTQVFPPGSARGDAVVIDSGRAVVDLSVEATTGDEVQRARMRQQLTETLRAFAVTDVVMTVDGFALPVPDDARGDAIVQPTVESAPLVLIDGTFGFATRQDVNRIPGVSQKVEALSPRAVAYSTARAQAAVLNDEGVWFVPGAGDPVLLDERAGLVEPSIDNKGFVWSAQSGDPASIRAFGPDGAVHEVKSSLTDDAELVAMRVSRDGARMLLYLDSGSGPRLRVAGIVRQQDAPLSLTTGALELAPEQGTPVDATWVDEHRVATLSGESGDVRVRVYELSGPSQSLGEAPGGERIVGGNAGVAGIRILAGDSLMQRRGSAWQSTGVSASLLATQH